MQPQKLTSSSSSGGGSSFKAVTLTTGMTISTALKQNITNTTTQILFIVEQLHKH